MDSPSHHRDVPTHLENFLLGTQGIAEAARLSDPLALPARLRRPVADAEARGDSWIALRSGQEYMVAWGVYDVASSAALRAHVLWIEWRLADHERHAGYWHCYHDRPREWIAGRGG